MVLFDPAGSVLSSLTVPDPSPDYLYNEAAETPVLALAWHPRGSHLAVLPRGQSFAMVWSAEGGTARVDGGIKARFLQALRGPPAQSAGAAHDCCTTAMPGSTRAALHRPPALLPPLKPCLQPDEVTALAWCPSAPQLALGTAKGGGVVYDCVT